MKWIYAVALLGTIVLANWLTTEYGFVSVGFGLVATAGTYAAGLALGLRDLLQDTGGRWWVLGTILAGGVVSYLIADPFIALASAVAFTVGELADMAVYSPLRSRNWTGAVVASNLVGAVVDTAIFIGIAFGAAMIQGSMLGQIVGKAWATLALLVVVWGCRAVSVRRRPA